MTVLAVENALAVDMKLTMKNTMELDARTDRSITPKSSAKEAAERKVPPSDTI